MSTLGVGDRLHVVRCNHCRQPVLHAHRAMHALECRQRRNQQKLQNMNLTKDGKHLYAVAVTKFIRGAYRAPEVLYAHARNPAEAQRLVTAGEKYPIKVISVGLAVGWFQHEKSGIITG